MNIRIVVLGGGAGRRWIGSAPGMPREASAPYPKDRRGTPTAAKPPTRPNESGDQSAVQANRTRNGG